MANPFEILVTNLEAMGFFGFFLPFLFILAVTFAALLKTKVLGEDKKIIGSISLVLAFFIVGFGGPAIAIFFTTLFGFGTVVLAGLLVIILFLAMTGGDVSKMMSGGGVKYALVAVGIIVFFVAAGTAFGIRVTDVTWSIVLVILIIGASITFLMKG
ncbi:MAG: hypothetical protein HYW26_03210 [Candidatus Aenigmarchaeota archaeon]|nr:hypothetical protein [Candidatus Aenigmarchaeota archaeon]